MTSTTNCVDVTNDHEMVQIVAANSTTNNHHVTTEIGLWLERNQVGRALLLPSVIDTVPLGLWPTILAKAADSTSVLLNRQCNFIDDTTNAAAVVANSDDAMNQSKQRPPLDGLHYMMNGLLPYFVSGHR
jgi:hypothetical protein